MWLLLLLWVGDDDNDGGGKVGVVAFIQKEYLTNSAFSAI